MGCRQSKAMELRWDCAAEKQQRGKKKSEDELSVGTTETAATYLLSDEDVDEKRQGMACCLDFLSKLLPRNRLAAIVDVRNEEPGTVMERCFREQFRGATPNERRALILEEISPDEQRALVRELQRRFIQEDDDAQEEDAPHLIPLFEDLEDETPEAQPQLGIQPNQPYPDHQPLIAHPEAQPQLGIGSNLPTVIQWARPTVANPPNPNQPSIAPPTRGPGSTRA